MKASKFNNYLCTSDEAFYRGAMNFLVLGALATVAALPAASGASGTWANLGNQWTTTTNWTPNGGPQLTSSTSNTDIATFGNSGANFNAPDLTSNRTVLGLNFTAGANAYTFTTASGKIVDVMGTGITNNSTALQTFNVVVQNSNGNGLVSSIAGGSLLFSNGYNLTSGVNGVSGSSASRTVTFSGAGTITVAGGIANGGLATAGAVTVTSTGATTFSGSNTYDGTTTMNALGGSLSLSGDNSGADGLVTITAGTVKLGHANSLGSTVLGTTVASGAMLDLNGQTIGTEALSLAGTGIGSAGALVNTSGTEASHSGAVTLTADASISGNISLSGGVSGGTNKITKSGSGTLVLSGNNTYTGLTTVNASGGALTLSGNNSTASGGVTVTDGTLNINHTNALGSGTLTLTALSILNNTSGAAITNAGNNAITWGGTTPAAFVFGTSASTAANNLNLGSGTVTASTSRAMAFAGTGTTLSMGTLDSTSTSISRTFTFTGAGNTLVLAGIKLSNAATPNATTLAGSANLTVTGEVSNGTSNQAVSVNVSGTGITTFNGTNTYDGVTAIASGATLRIGSNSALGTTISGTTVASGGVLDLNGRTLGAETLSLSGTGISSSGALMNSNGAAASLSGAVTLTGNTTIGAGDISLGSIGESGGSRILTKTSGGTLTLAGTNTYTGGTVIVDGIVNINGGNNAGGSFKLDGSSTTPVLKLSHLNALATTATLAGASSSVNTGTVDFAVSGSYSLAAYTGNNMKFTASSGSATTLTFTGNSVISSSTAGSGGRTITNTDANLNLVFSGDLEIGSTATNTVAITGSGNTTVGGSVFNTGAGIRSLEKSGSGTLTLNGANSYNGITDLKGTGKVLINGNSSASTGDVSVGSSATLGGSGRVGGTINISGVLAPGNSIESLGSGSLNFITGSTYAYEIDATATVGLQGDLAYSSGTLDIATGTNLTLTELAAGTWASGAKLTLISYFADGGASGWNDGLFTYGSAIADDSSITIGSQIWTFNYNDLTGGTNYVADQTGTRFVTITAIPEPNVAMLFGGLGVLALVRRRQVR
ncbi:MAG: hypothetical protein RLZZ214_4074 [Verrucomicrobiota bacterium]|jgi:autotransporter-associated beta strand protein